jgi:hypothetical protein
MNKLYLNNIKYTGCRKINVFQVGGLVGKNLRNLEKIKRKIYGGDFTKIYVSEGSNFSPCFLQIKNIND